MRNFTLLLTFCLGLVPFLAEAQTIFLTDFEGRPGKARIETSGNGTAQIRLDLFLEETIADIRGIFFDLETQFEDFSISGPQVTGWYADIFKTDPLGMAADHRFGHLSRSMNLNGTGASFSFAVELGTPGAGRDDIRSSSLILSNAIDMTLKESVGMRLMSVGGNRSGSLKLLGENETPASVPEPGTFVLLGLGLLTAGRMGRYLYPRNDLP